MKEIKEMVKYIPVIHDVLDSLVKDAKEFREDRILFFHRISDHEDRIGSLEKNLERKSILS